MRTLGDFQTSCYLAAENGKEEVVQLMLHEAQERAISLVDTVYGQTALNLASANGHVHVVRLLLSQDTTKIDTKISFSLAYEKNQREIMKIILVSADFKTQVTLAVFSICQMMQSLKNQVSEKKMSLMILFFVAVLATFILSVHLRKL